MSKLPSLYRVMKFSIALVWFLICVIIVKPSLGTAVVPLVSDLRGKVGLTGQTQGGINLDPLIVDTLADEDDGDGHGLVAGVVTGPSQVEMGAIVPNSKVLKTELEFKDLRVVAMNKFLEKKRCPIEGYGAEIVQAADEYGIDWRAVIAVATLESGPCRVIPKDSYNCWGWKEGPGKYMKFDSWSHGIRYISQRFGEAYGDSFNPMAIEAAYCPPCAESGEHKWANGVKGYMNDIKRIMEEL